MTTFRNLSISLAVGLAVVAVAPAAYAETEAAEEAPKTGEVTEAAPAPEAEEEESSTSGWFRVDTDSLQTQFWLGATHDFGGLAIASDIYVVGSFAEFDIGPSFSFGNLALTPMVGIGFDFENSNVSSLIAPQLFSIYDMEKLYFESWIQVFLLSPFEDGAEDDFYTRNFLLYKASDEIAVGPQVEVLYALNSEDGDGTDENPGFESGVVSLPVGGRVNLGYGKNNTLGIFLGYDLEGAEGSDKVAGRFTFVRTW